MTKLLKMSTAQISEKVLYIQLFNGRFLCNINCSRGPSAVCCYIILYILLSSSRCRIRAKKP